VTGHIENGHRVEPGTSPDHVISMVARYLVAGAGLRKPTVDLGPKRWAVGVVTFESGLPLPRLDLEDERRSK